MLYRFIAPSNKNHDDITVKIWDFEGQEINHQSHQFFLTRNTFYIIVFNGRRGLQKDRLEYWLDTIKHRAPGSKTILVATECEKSSPSFSIHELDEQYQRMIIEDSYFAVGCENGKNIETLKQRLVEIAFKQGLIPRLWPVKYTDAETKIVELAKQGKHYISRQSFNLLLGESNLHENDYENIGKVLLELGVITQFPECDLLHDFIVLNPEWLTKAVSMALESEELKDAQGEMKLSWLKKLWKRDYPDLFPKIYQCMKEFELCYQLEDGQGIAMVPLRFPSKRPAQFPWIDNHIIKERRIEFHFDGNPPAGLMSRFIVKAHHMVKVTSEMEKGVFWKEGVFLETNINNELSQALCELDKEKRIIRFRVKAAYPQNMIERLEAFMEAVFGFYKGFTLRKYYGCVLENDAPCPNVHIEKKVLVHLEKEERILCEERGHFIEPYDLVYGFSSFSSKGDLREILRTELDKKPEWARGFGLDMDNIMVRFDHLESIVMDQIKTNREIPSQIRQMLQQNQRELMAIFDLREQSNIPAIFMIHPLKKSWRNLTNLFQESYKLQFYCEHEHGAHPGSYEKEFSMSRKWWTSFRPIFSISLKVLSIALGPAFAVAPVIASETDYKQIKDELNLAKEFLKTLPSELDDTKEPFNEIRNSSAKGREYWEMQNENMQKDLAQFELAIKEIDPASYQSKQWGNLKRYHMPDNTYRWLCALHRPDKEQIVEG